MKALMSTAPGGPETLSLIEQATPSPRKGEVIVAVKAAGVNYPDTLIIKDLYQFKPPRPFAPGNEVAGVVEALGEGVTHLSVGDRVAATLAPCGGFATHAAAPAAATFPIGDMPFEEAAALVMTYGTSLHALKDRAALAEGETLLILGASGGVGSAAIELGKAIGARVVGAVSSTEKADFVKELGADEAIVYPKGDLSRDDQKALSASFKEACGKNGADVIYDAVGGPYAEPALRAIAWEGRYLVVGFPAGIPTLPLNLPLLKGCQIVGVFWGAAVQRDPKGHEANLTLLKKLVADGAIQPRVTETFPLERGAEALKKLESRSATGKLVITMP
ncbi:oxidoreductase, zinc-binding dehydrogenase family protein [Parvularcula bermudensis HTCC2503]|uniref:Oxidoreductase, zinc-binding dehydrogenase family protein n=1 Tax=Parvularcula bermudensis (strain ATCC BAA-594 / HTCC2503 / KCTC 12087) TaxID=314260 RepID=E0TBF3_PARBH|nr:NADPH:quinone oxidoreductase family protein [Parvularcula bermudensis]ADM09750.1 oxidoreductase, zinc-binding dehydrogenase family protein [Parvularcula bermudensis HTCC2503]